MRHLAGSHYAAAPKEAGDAHAAILKRLLPFVWPKGRPDLRLRLVLAAAALIAAKIVTMAMPLAYKAAVDALTEFPQADAGAKAAQIAAVPLALIVAYGVARISMTGFVQLRDVLFTHIGQHATRVLATETFRHVHDLSLRFHLERKTGGLSRVLDRGKLAIDLIIRMGALNLFPTILEVLFVCLLFGFYFGWELVAIVLAMIAIYAWFSFFFSERRIKIRREYIEADMDATTKSIDSLLNYETVKYFGNERWEAAPLRPLDGALRAREHPHLQLARVAQRGPGLYFHRRHGSRHAARGAGRRRGNHDGGRFRAGERGFHPALPAAQRDGHDLSRDEAGAGRHRSDVHAARAGARGEGQAGREAACRRARRDPLRERAFRL